MEKQTVVIEKCDIFNITKEYIQMSNVKYNSIFGLGDEKNQEVFYVISWG